MARKVISWMCQNQSKQIFFLFYISYTFCLLFDPLFPFLSVLSHFSRFPPFSFPNFCYYLRSCFSGIDFFLFLFPPISIVVLRSLFGFILVTCPSCLPFFGNRCVFDHFSYFFISYSIPLTISHIVYFSKIFNFHRHVFLIMSSLQYPRVAYIHPSG